jgi:methionine biosynthesis protein MetW
VEETVGRYYDEYWGAELEPHYEPEPTLSGLIFRELTPETRVLDVGCGTGRSYAPKLARLTGSYVGVDVSERAVEAARATGLDARVIDDASDLPFAQESFDLITCIEVLEHLFVPHLALAEMHRVLSPGGRLVVSAPNMAYWRMRLNALLGIWNPAGDALSLEQPWRDPHIRFFTLGSMEGILRRNGFPRVEIGAHGGRALDHMSSRPTSFGQGRLYRIAERRFPSLLGMTIHAVAIR